jgi:NAD-dependent deacetylase
LESITSYHSEPIVNVLVLTGAGISAESGIPTFRGKGGLWEGYRFEQVATPEAFERDPQLVHRFYNARRRQLLAANIRPNAAHRALAGFERDAGCHFLLVTQNIDDLHRRAGSRRIIPMHGELLKARCQDTGELFEWRGDLSHETPHPHFPRRLGRLRPHVVWFGESPFGMDEILTAAREADIFLSIGTSGTVYPAAGIVSVTPRHCRRIEINLDDTPRSPLFAEHHRGKASELVPRVLETLLEPIRKGVRPSPGIR